MKEPRHRFLAVIAAPSGDLMPWTEHETGEGAKRRLLRGHRTEQQVHAWWAFAVRQGYALRWVRDMVAGR